MKRLHLDDDIGLTSAAIDDILDHGSLDDWLVLRDAAERDRSIADRIRRVCSSHEMYGTSALWIEIVNLLDENRR